MMAQRAVAGVNLPSAASSRLGCGGGERFCRCHQPRARLLFHAGERSDELSRMGPREPMLESIASLRSEVIASVLGVACSSLGSSDDGSGAEFARAAASRTP